MREEQWLRGEERRAEEGAEQSRAEQREEFGEDEKRREEHSRVEIS